MMKFSDLFVFDIWANPYRTWWKARKYFKRPKMKLHFFGSKALGWTIPYASVRYPGKILTIFCADVMWKDKWNSPRHERDPYIWVCFFNKFGFSINFNIQYIEQDGKVKDGGMYYWEYLLDYLYYRKDIKKYDKWTCHPKEFDEYDIQTHEFSLNENGLKKFNEK